MASGTSIGIWVLGDQLNLAQSALAAHQPGQARVLMVESLSVLQTQTYHRQKLVLVWSAMRHFAADLRAAGWCVDYMEAESFGRALGRWTRAHDIRELHVMEAAERPFRRSVDRVVQALPQPRLQLVWHPSNAFLWDDEAFSTWAQSYKQLRLELFYREGRRRFGVLIEPGPGRQPLGGQWNYDHDNRRAPPRGLKGPAPLRFAPDPITDAVIEKVEQIALNREKAGEPGLPGRSRPFGWAVSQQQALAALEHFIDTRLDGFGPYQDAMVSGEPTLWHALLSPYLNLGLLHPLEVIRRLEEAGRQRNTPIASLEGVIRQILGWREYTHALYRWFGSEYSHSNHFRADQPLPSWLEQLGGSGMSCLDTVLGEISDVGYAHHIQRLMVLANYGLIAGLDPQALTRWFHRMFIDGYDWVMQTNVLGMGLFADGGRLASKPYAASGSYINRMSTYCKSCRYDPKQRSGEAACPFNVLYWDFLARHATALRSNPRMALVIRQLDRIPMQELEAIQAGATSHRRAQRGGDSAAPRD
jgi:deoxyribodipyrimidine photolyase-related protein